ncbi:hypothetical protein G1L03_12470 [Tenacibaculum finnmarkense]|nr:hypothetical protein [Tenacibaculum finnmarkense]
MKLDKSTVYSRKKILINLIDDFPHLDFTNDSVYNHFYLIDLDLDKDLDVVYIGPSGAESDCVIIYCNGIDGFSLLFEDFQSRIKFNVIDNKIVDFELTQDGCCGDHFSKVNKKYSTEFDFDSFKFKLKEGYFLFENTHLPIEKDNKLQEERFYRVLKNSNLRFSSVIDNSINEKYADFDIKGNIIGVLEENSIVKVLHIEKGDVKRDWCYIEGNLNITKANLKIYSLNKGEIFKYRGWVSSNVLIEEIDNKKYVSIFDSKYTLEQVRYIEQWQGEYSFKYGRNHMGESSEGGASISVNSVGKKSSINLYWETIKDETGEVIDKGESTKELTIVRTTKDFLELRGEENDEQYMLYKTQFIEDSKKVDGFAIKGSSVYMLSPPNNDYPLTKK